MEVQAWRCGRLSYGRSNHRKRAMAVMIFSFCIFSQECLEKGRAERVQEFSRRRLLQGDPSAPPVGYAMSQQIVVDANGLGDYTTVQGAVDAVPAGNPQKVVIRINAGDYV
jgi:pectin methylesterase-like acyl-CoA thioesterase